MQQKPATELIKDALLNILPGGHMYHIEYA